ncbi:MAG: hypothetical protein DIU79_03440, partial [Actinobacteria bacterium]
MEWGIVTGVVGALVGALAAVIARRVLTRRDRRRAADRGPLDPELLRQSLDSLQVGVVVLDAGDQPVLVNAAARAMGLLRAGTSSVSGTAHPILRTLAGQVRRTGVRREVDLDLPRGREDVPRDLGVHLRAVGLDGEHVAIEATDVTEAHRVARMRRDFVANVSHELKTPIGALQLLAEALRDAISADGAATPSAPAAGPAKTAPPAMAVGGPSRGGVHTGASRAARAGPSWWGAV